MSDSSLSQRSARFPGIGVWRFSAVHFLAALLLMIFITPFVDQPPFGEQAEAVVLTIVMLLGMLAVGGRRRTLTLSIFLVIPALGAKWFENLRPGVIPVYLVPVLSLGFMSLMITLLMRFVIRAGRVNAEVLCAAISAYISMGMLWMFAYVLADRLNPGSFAVFGQPTPALDTYEAFYFSFITLISIGYGDITPASRVTQMLAILEGMAGMLFVVTMISRLASLYPRNQPTQP